MATATSDPFPPLWRILGLSVAAGYAGLGSYAAFLPLTSSTQVGLRSGTSTADSDKNISTAMLWIGARDFSIAAALFAFYYQDKPAEMGTVILSGMILCVVDCVTYTRMRGAAPGSVMCAGAAIWGVIGWNLLQL